LLGDLCWTAPLTQHLLSAQWDDIRIKQRKTKQSPVSNGTTQISEGWKF